MYAEFTEIAGVNEPWWLTDDKKEINKNTDTKVDL